MYWGRRTLGDGGEYIFPDFVARAIVSAEQNEYDTIEDYVAVQDSATHIAVHLQLGTDSPAMRATLENRITGNLHSLFETFGCRVPHVACSWTIPGAFWQDRKHIRVLRSFAVPEEDSNEKADLG